jgi:hypothetical protein
MIAEVSFSNFHIHRIIARNACRLDHALPWDGISRGAEFAQTLGAASALKAP